MMIIGSNSNQSQLLNSYDEIGNLIIIEGVVV